MEKQYVSTIIDNYFIILLFLKMTSTIIFLVTQ